MNAGKVIQRFGGGVEEYISSNEIFSVEKKMVVHYKDSTTVKTRRWLLTGTENSLAMEIPLLAESLLIFENDAKQATIYVHSLQWNTMQNIRPRGIFPYNASFSWGSRELTIKMDTYMEILFLLRAREARPHAAEMHSQHCKLVINIHFSMKTVSLR